MYGRSKDTFYQAESWIHWAACRQGTEVAAGGGPELHFWTPAAARVECVCVTSTKENSKVRLLYQLGAHLLDGMEIHYVLAVLEISFSKWLIYFWNESSFGSFTVSYFLISANIEALSVLCPRSKSLSHFVFIHINRACTSGRRRLVFCLQKILEEEQQWSPPNLRAAFCLSFWFTLLFFFFLLPNLLDPMFKYHFTVCFIPWSADICNGNACLQLLV